MANKVVQLIDNNNDNIFPVAGSMAEDSITTEMVQDGSVTKDKIDWSTIKYEAGDSLTIMQTMTGQVRNLSSASQNDIGYFTVILPFEIAGGVNVNVSAFSISDIVNIGYASSTRTVDVLDSNNESVSKTDAHMFAEATIDSNGRRSLQIRFGLKDGYHWSGATSYNAVQFRSTLLTLTFS